MKNFWQQYRPKVIQMLDMWKRCTLENRNENFQTYISGWLLCGIRKSAGPSLLVNYVSASALCSSRYAKRHRWTQLRQIFSFRRVQRCCSWTHLQLLPLHKNCNGSCDGTQDDICRKRNFFCISRPLQVDVITFEDILSIWEKFLW